MNPLTYAAAIAAAALLAFAGLQTVRLSHAQAETAAVRSTLDRERLQAAQAAAAATQAARTEEQRRTAAQQEITDVAHAQIDRARSAGGRAAVAGAGLRVRVAAVAAGCGAGPADTAAAPGSPAASAPGDLLADVLGRLERDGRELAAAADASRIAGQACVSAYDSLTPAAAAASTPERTSP